MVMIPKNILIFYLINIRKCCLQNIFLFFFDKNQFLFELENIYKKIILCYKKKTLVFKIFFSTLIREKTFFKFYFEEFYFYFYFKKMFLIFGLDFLPNWSKHNFPHFLFTFIIK